MAHGFGATVRCGLEAFAERFALAGWHALAFDYRFFGASEGEPRQLLDPSAQIEDWKSVIDWARARDDVDADRIALWGTSYSGGGAIVAAANDGRIAAISALVPMMDSQDVAKMVQKRESIGWLLRVGVIALWDLARGLVGASPRYIDTVGTPGSIAALTAHGSKEKYVALASDDWENRVCARIMITGGSFRPILHIERVGCPVLFQIADDDELVPNAATERAASSLGERATVVRYAGDHFTQYEGAGFERAVADEIAFFEKHLTAPSDRSRGR
jgi:pimeloyl-ACP methyl ester carboxylesterase